MTNDEIGKQIVDASLKVHKALGPGMLESCYEICLAHELSSRGLKVQCQVPIPIIYDGIKLEHGFRADMIVEDQVVVEIKATNKELNIFEAQLLSYMKLGHYKLGFLINFNVSLIKDGIFRRII